MFEKPSPKANAIIHNCVEMPNTWATGTINGINKNAFAEPDGIKKFIINTIKYMNKMIVYFGNVFAICIA